MVEGVTEIVFVGDAAGVGIVPGAAQLVLEQLRLGLRVSDEQQAKRGLHAASSAASDEGRRRARETEHLPTTGVYTRPL